MARLLGDRRRILSVVRSHHIYGFLFTVLLPRAWQLPGTQVLDARAMLPSSLLSRLHDGDVVIGYPDWWRGIAESARKFPPGVIGVTSTAPCSADVANRLHQSGLESLVQVYGSSETAGVGVRASTTNPFELLSYWRRSGTNADEIIRTAPEGHQTTRRVPDVIEWADERHFLPLERRDGAVQVGGINVSPAEVRAVLIAHPDVGDATVRLMTGERLGRLKAFVVPSRSDVDRRALHAALEQWVTVRLAAPQRPRAFTFGDAIPRDALGKASDWRADAIEVPDER